MILRELLKRYLPTCIVRTLRELRISRGELLLIKLRFLSIIGLRRKYIDDYTWFELQFKPREALKYYGITLPSFPTDDVQRRFTARVGRNNLQQAFSFYRYVYSACNLNQVNEPRILDFGGGWGRISRFFLKDTKPEHILITDCMNTSIHWLKATGNPCNILKNEPLPPIAGLNMSFDLIYSFSVFSHLSEQFLRAWLTYLMESLRPGGFLVFTTRGHQFINDIESLYRENSSSSLREKLPHHEEVRARYIKGEFQFYPTGGGDELNSDCYGETLVPRSYIEANYRSVLVDFTEEVPDVDQSIVVLQKTQLDPD